MNLSCSVSADKSGSREGHSFSWGLPVKIMSEYLKVVIIIILTLISGNSRRIQTIDLCLHHTCSSMNLFQVEQTKRALNISSKLSFNNISVRNLVKPQPMEKSLLTVCVSASSSFLCFNFMINFFATAGSILPTVFIQTAACWTLYTEKTGESTKAAYG